MINESLLASITQNASTKSQQLSTNQIISMSDNFTYNARTAQMSRLKDEEIQQIQLINVLNKEIELENQKLEQVKERIKILKQQLEQQQPR